MTELRKTMSGARLEARRWPPRAKSRVRMEDLRRAEQEMRSGDAVGGHAVEGEEGGWAAAGGG